MSEKKTKLFRIRKTVCKMLNARGYLVAQAELDRDKDSFTEEFGEDPRRDALTLQFDLREDPTQHIFVFFPDEEKVGVKTIKEYAKRMKDEQVNRAIIVVQQSLTPFARQSLLECQAQKFYIEQFQEAELLVNITDEERQASAPVAAPGDGDCVELHELWRLNQVLAGDHPNLLEVHPELLGAWQDLHLRYLNGEVDIRGRARGEQLYTNGLLALRARLDPRRRQQRDLLDRLNEILADKLFVNFSVFQSVPDVWGIDQVFPVLPLSGLDQPATRRGVLQDITCDSDGRIDQYVDGEGVEATLPLPETLNRHLGIFMVGAYQEILGDMHNLFGDTDSVDVNLNERGEIELTHAIQGDTVSSVKHVVGGRSFQLTPASHRTSARAAAWLWTCPALANQSTGVNLI